jgi:hypothetical protein
MEGRDDREQIGTQRLEAAITEAVKGVGRVA